MAEILHKISINAPPDRVYEALSTIDGLANWWTSTTSGESASGKSITFRFGEHDVVMRVSALEPGKRVAWECTKSAAEWVGTKLTFDLTPDGGGSGRGFAQGLIMMSHPAGVVIGGLAIGRLVKPTVRRKLIRPLQLEVGDLLAQPPRVRRDRQGTSVPLRSGDLTPRQRCRTSVTLLEQYHGQPAFIPNQTSR